MIQQSINSLWEIDKFFQYSGPSKHDPSCKYDNARFTTAPLKALSDHVWIKYHVNQALSMLLDLHENK